MADLTLALLNTEFGDDVFSVSGANITIDTSKLLGETSFSLSDPKVAELLTDLLDLASAAQATYNANSANTTKIDSYPQPVSGVPSFDTTANKFFVTSTYSFSSRAPLDKAATTAVNA